MKIAQLKRLTPMFAVVVAALCMLPACSAARLPDLGVGEQQGPGMFTSEPWKKLGLKYARIQVSWNVMRHADERETLDRWVQAAQTANATVLISFGQARGMRGRGLPPSPKRFLREFQAVRRRYPSVHEFITWNEANHCSQPLCHKPELAAQYFNALRRDCPSCTIVAADVLDSPGMVKWLKRFIRVSASKAPLWGLHNYFDANRIRTTGTGLFLKTVRGDVWFTETGGIVRRYPRVKHPAYPYTVKHAAIATRWVFRLAQMSPRVKRIYFYHWQALPSPTASWDSGLLDSGGHPRPAYFVIERWLRETQQARSQQPQTAGRH